MILDLKDGGIINIESDNRYFSGCDTCDFGSQYINYFDISLTKKEISIEATESYEYGLSEGYMMKTLLQNVEEIKKMTEDEFTKWLKKEISKEVKNVDFLVKEV